MGVLTRDQNRDSKLIQELNLIAASFLEVNRVARESTYLRDRRSRLDDLVQFDRSVKYEELDFLFEKLGYLKCIRNGDEYWDFTNSIIVSGAHLFRGVSFRKGYFEKTTLRSFIESQFHECVFNGINLSDSAFEFYFESCTFDNVQLSRRDASFGHYVNCKFNKCRLEGLHGAFSGLFCGCCFEDCSFTGSGLGRSRFINCAVKKCDFRGARLQFCEYDETSFVDCSFQETAEGIVPPGITT